MRSIKQLRVLFVALALFGLQLAASAQSTTWTGAVSTDWNNSANWSAGLPSATRDAVLGPATRGCVVPVTTTPVPVRDLTVQVGASLTVPAGAQLLLSGNLDYGATILGNGTVAMANSNYMQTTIARGRNAASLYRLDVTAVLAGYPAELRLTDLTVRQDLIADTGANLGMYGRNEITGRLSFRGPISVSVRCEPTGTLIVGFLDSFRSVVVPGTFRAGRIYVPYSSSISPSAGVIVFPTGTTTRIEGAGGTIGPAHIQAGATVYWEGQGSGGSSQPGGLYAINCEGTLVIEPRSNAVGILGGLSVAGEVRFRGPNNHPNGPGSTAINTSLTILQGGRLVFEPYSTNTVFLAPGGTSQIAAGGTLLFDHASVSTYAYLYGSPQVHGTLQCVGQSTVNVANSLTVGPTGSLRLFAVSGLRPLLSAPEVQLQGDLYAADCEMQFSGPGGLKLLPGSRITSTLWTTLTSSSSDPNAVLLDISRTEPTLLSSLTFGTVNGSNPAKGVRASSPHPVQISYSSGPRAGSAFEDDPLGVISWSNGVTYAGAATPGCLGLAECETTGDARLGNASFAFRCRRAHPSGAAIFLLGWGSATTPYPFANLNLWFNPALPLTSVFRTADATGTVVSPQPLPANPAFAGLTFTGQFVLFEPPGCTTTNLSASTAAHIVLQP